MHRSILAGGNGERGPQDMIPMLPVYSQIATAALRLAAPIRNGYTQKEDSGAVRVFIMSQESEHSVVDLHERQFRCLTQRASLAVVARAARRILPLLIDQ